MDKTIDCTLCGSCVVDILVRPVPLTRPIGAGMLIHTEPIRVTTGGIVSNCAIAMARLGMKTAAFSYVGRDEWASVISRKYEAEGIDSSRRSDKHHRGPHRSWRGEKLRALRRRPQTPRQDGLPQEHGPLRPEPPDGGGILFSHA